MCWLNNFEQLLLIDQLEERESDVVLPLIDKAFPSNKVVAIAYPPPRNEPGKVCWCGQACLGEETNQPITR